MKTSISILLLILLTGCTGTTGNKRTVKLYEAFPPAEDYPAIVEKYGEPTSSWETTDGNQVHQYQYVKFRYSPIAYLPFIYFFTKTSGVNYEAVLVVDADDKVVDSRRFYSRLKGPHNGTCSTSKSPTQCIETTTE